MTDQHCTRCGKEFEPFEDVIVVGTAIIMPNCPHPDDFAPIGCDFPYLEVLCSTCRTAPKPNRVVVEVKGGMVQGVRAERPDEVLVMVYASTDTLEFPYRPKTFGGLHGEPIEQLNTMKEEA